MGTVPHYIVVLVALTSTSIIIEKMLLQTKDRAAIVEAFSIRSGRRGLQQINTNKYFDVFVQSCVHVVLKVSVFC